MWTDRIPGIDPTAGTLLALTVGLAVGVPTSATPELKRETLADFHRYVEVAEKRFLEQVGPHGPFLHVDHLADGERQEIVAGIRRGELYMEKLELRDAEGEEIEIDDGLVHHWVGAVFVPDVGVDQVLELVQSYGRHDEIYAPDVQESRIIERDGDRFEVFLRFRKKKVITVIVDTVHAVTYHRPARDRSYSISRTTEVREVENAGEEDERRLPPGEGRGFLWRLNSYWRFLERDGGVWIESESISLTRGIPFLLRWLIGPFVSDVPEESLTFLLETTRDELLGAEGVVVPTAAPRRPPLPRAATITGGRGASAETSDRASRR